MSKTISFICFDLFGGGGDFLFFLFFWGGGGMIKLYFMLITSELMIKIKILNKTVGRWCNGSFLVPASAP